MPTPSREEAFTLLKQYNQTESLVKHALCVEAVMRHFAEKQGEDIERWGAIGLLHDLDYEKFPEQHCAMSEKLLRENGCDEADIHAVISHGYGLVNDVEPVEYMEKVLYGADELTGLITAYVYMLPERDVRKLELKGVKKKFKAKAFAAGVNRDVVQKGAQMLGIELDELISETLLGMQKAAETIGLAGA